LSRSCVDLARRSRRWPPTGCFDGWPHIVSGKFDIESRSWHDRQRLPRLEAEPRVKAVGEQQRDGNAELLGRHLIDAQLDFRDLLFGRTIGFALQDATGVDSGVPSGIMKVRAIAH
jgi:hypothetical protein